MTVVPPFRNPMISWGRGPPSTFNAQKDNPDQRMRSVHFALVALSCMVLVAAGLGWAGAAASQQSQALVPRAVLKLIIDHPALAPYLHPEVTGRVPLVVSDHL